MSETISEARGGNVLQKALRNKRVSERYLYCSLLGHLGSDRRRW